VIRCAAGPGIGWGHAARCIALAQLALEGGLPPPLLIGPTESRAAALAREAGLTWQPLAGTPEEGVALAEAMQPGSWLVLDDYALGPADASRLRRLLGCRVLALDDQGLWDDPAADAVLAMSAASEGRTYSRTKAFQGPRYMPLRRMIRSARPAEDRRGCLVALGAGATPARLRSVVGAVAGVTPVRVAPSASVEERDMAEALAGFGSAEILPIGELAASLTTATVCVCNGGLVKYEATALGCLPVVVGGTETEAQDSAVLAARGLVAQTTIEGLQSVIERHCKPSVLGEFRVRAAAAQIGSKAQAVVDLLAS
jgi:spore coat polysaccharide biosynthesis predicted glycosyltransferase SpsG